MALGETILWSPWSENPILWFIPSLDFRFYIYGSRFKNWTGINQSIADNIPMRSLSHKLVLGIQAATSWEKTSLLIEWMKCFPTTRAVCSAPQLSVYRFQTLKILPLCRALLLIFEYKFIIAGFETLREANYSSRGARRGLVVSPESLNTGCPQKRAILLW